MKVLITDPVSEAAIKQMTDAGLQVDAKTDLTPDQLIATVGDYDAMVVRSATKVTKDVIAAGKNLKLIVRGGVGIDNIDVKAAKEHNVEVRNTPAASSISVAELTIGHMLALFRHIARGTSGLKAGQWEKKKLKGNELYQKTLGLIGIGRIGKEVARRALAFGMKVIAYDPYVKDVPGLDVKLVSLDELVSQSDVISLHTPKTDETDHILGAEEFARMKDGVVVINCGRGGLIDEEALYNALESGKAGGAALDCYETEPPGASKLLEHDRVIGTPHIGAATKEGQNRVGDEVASILIEYAGK